MSMAPTNHCDLTISVAPSRYAKKWEPKTLTWDQLANQLAATTRTRETTAEYAQMSREQKAEIKDVGGFVGGVLRGGRRRKDAVLARYLVSLDLDQAKTDTAKRVKQVLKPWSHLVCSTHSHTPTRPRLRVIVPLAHPISPARYVDVATRMAGMIGIGQADKTTFEPHRLMYWPSTPKDGKYYYHRHDAEFLDADRACLLAVPGPASATIEDPAPLADPQLKPGLIGAYCRAWPITKLLAGPLNHQYKPTSHPDRWSYANGSSTGGLIVYEDTWAFSHHSTDPACDGHDHNSFDLTRIHLFGHLDRPEDQDKPITEQASYKAMMAYAAEEEKTCQEANRTRLNDIGQDFGIVEAEADRSWLEKLTLNRNGTPRDTIPNQKLIIENTAAFDTLAYDQLSDAITVRRPEDLPWKQVKTGWTKTDMAQLQGYLQETWDIYAPARTEAAVLSIAAQRAYHPVRQYLDQLPNWDNTPRLDTLLINYLGADDNEYVRQATRKMVHAMIGRVLQPGTKFDNVLILCGPQGIGKSMIFQKLGQQWFSDALNIEDMKTKAGPEKLQGYWLLELSELAGMRKMDVETIKSFITTTDDKYRPAYGTVVEAHPRQCVIVGSTNADTGFLRDITGNRRFWPINVTGQTSKKPWQLTCAEIDQIFAEALYGYAQDQTLFLTGQAAAQAQQAQTVAMEADDREGLVREYLNRALPGNWEEMTLHERRSFLGSDGDPLAPALAGLRARRRVSNVEIWAECFGQDPALMAKRDAHEIGTIMAGIPGWARGSGTTRIPIYGKQRLYVRESACGEGLVDDLPF